MENEISPVHIMAVLTENLLSNNNELKSKLMQYRTISKSFSESIDDDEDLEFFHNHFIGNLSNSSHELWKMKMKTRSSAIRSSIYRRRNSFLMQKKYPKIFRLSNNKIKNLDLLNIFDNKQFESLLHMKKMHFLNIFKFLRNVFNSSTYSLNAPPECLFSLAIWKLTTNENFRNISIRFGIPLSTCEIMCQQFYHLIYQNYELYIKWPNSQLSQRIQLEGFQKHSTLHIFKGLFGVLGLKRLNATIKSKKMPIFIQIVCNVDQRIIDCFIEVIDKYNFDDSPVGQMLTLSSSKLSRDNYLIGDKCFPLRSYLMRPFSTPNSSQEINFNKTLEPALLLAEDTFNLISKRFKTFCTLESNNLLELRQIIQTICTLYNLSIYVDDDNVDCKLKIINSNYSHDTEFNSPNFKANECDLKALQRRRQLIESITKYKQSH